MECHCGLSWPLAGSAAETLRWVLSTGHSQGKQHSQAPKVFMKGCVQELGRREECERIIQELE